MDRKTVERANEIIMQIKNTEDQINALSCHNKDGITLFVSRPKYSARDFYDIPITIDELNLLIENRQKIKEQLEKELEELH